MGARRRAEEYGLCVDERVNDCQFPTLGFGKKSAISTHPSVANPGQGREAREGGKHTWIRSKQTITLTKNKKENNREMVIQTPARLAFFDSHSGKRKTTTTAVPSSEHKTQNTHPLS